MKKKKKKRGGTVEAYFHLSIQSGLVCNDKIKLKSDRPIRIRILNDRYRPIDLYVFKKKQTNKNKKKIMSVSKSVIKMRNQPPNKQRIKQN